MSEPRQADERVLQDYLDGRLDAAGRAAFEARLAHEPELSRRLRSACGLREALGGSGPELPAGFYSRARARFEEASKGRPAFRIRALSWETAGLAAAAVLAIAVFLPPLLEQGVPDDSGAGAIEPMETAGRAEVDVPAKSREKKEAPGDREPARERFDRAAEASAPSFDDDAGPDAVAGTEKRSAGTAGVADANETGMRVEASGDEISKLQDRRAVGQLKQEPSVPAAPVALAEGTEETESLRVVATTRPATAELPTGSLAEDTLRVVSDIGAWRTLLAGPGGRALELLGPPADSRRLVLIGPRPGLVCAALVLTASGREDIVDVDPTLQGPPAAGGCALVATGEGRSTRLGPWLTAERDE